MSGLQAPWAEVQWTIGEGWRLPVEMGRVAAVRWRVRKRRGAFKWLDGGRAAQAGARIGGRVLDTHARN